ncbi:MAG: hypothetical protein M3442_01590 [Chloroflexota bacterium]|nr:hypothetical protein [Chloroflexota bacterium]
MTSGTTGQTSTLGQQPRLLLQRLLGGSPHLAQVWFHAAVLDKYRQAAGYKVIRTASVGRVRGPQWTLDFGIAGESDSLIHVSAGEIAGRLPEPEQGHWAEHGVGPPASHNYVLMQVTRGACIDDGDVRPW